MQLLLGHQTDRSRMTRMCKSWVKVHIHRRQKSQHYHHHHHHHHHHPWTLAGMSMKWQTHFLVAKGRCRTFCLGASKTVVRCLRGQRIVLCINSSCGCKTKTGVIE